MAYQTLILAACVALAAAQPVTQKPAGFKQAPAEVLFREAANQSPVLECVVEGSAKQIKYSWKKDGQSFDPKSNSDITQRQNEGTLVFLKPKNSDEGIYQCFAESEDGISTANPITLKKTYIKVPTVTVKKHSPVEGKPLKLDCSIPDAYPKPTIAWLNQQDSDPLVTNPIHDRRIITAPDGNLYFSNVTEKDIVKNFKYVCLGKTPASDKDVVLAEHILSDLVKADKPNDGELTEQYLTKDMTAKVGDVTMIYCIYGGTPMVFPDWFKDGTNTNNEPSDRVTRYNRSSGKRLLIKETWLEDQGIYSCQVGNEVGQPQQHSMYLTVVSAPKFEKKAEPQVIAKEGEDVTLPCEVSALPPPSVSWTYNAQPLTSNDRISIGQSSKQSPAVASLTIKNVKKSDKGYYGCKAHNEHGDAYTETLLVVA